MVKYCQICGSKFVTDDSLFCSKCGAKVNISHPLQKNAIIIKKPEQVESNVNNKKDEERNKNNDLLSEAISLHEKGDNQESLSLFNEILKTDPTNKDALLFKTNIERDIKKKENDEIQKKNKIVRENIYNTLRPQQIAILKELLGKYVSGLDECFLSTIFQFISTDTYELHSLYRDDSKRNNVIRQFQQYAIETQERFKSCHSLEERHLLESESRNQQNLIEFLLDLGKIKKVIRKKGLILKSRDIIETFYQELEKQNEIHQDNQQGLLQDVLAPYLSLLKKKLGTNPTLEAVIKEVLITPLEIGNKKSKILNPEIFQWILEEFGITCSLERISNIIGQYEEEFELEQFENDLGNPKRTKDNFPSIVDLSTLDGYEFEYFLKDLFEKMGYTVFVTPASKDQGADLIISNNFEKIAIQAKKYSGPVSNSAVQEIVAAMKYYEANKAMVVTTSVFTPSAIDLAYKNEVILWDGDHLNEVITEVNADHLKIQNAIKDFIDGLYQIMLDLFNDIRKLDERTTIKFLTRLFDNDIKSDALPIYRENRESRISFIRKIFDKMGFKTNNNTIEEMYDSIITDMDLQKIPNNSVLHHQFEVKINSDEGSPDFLEFVCPVCDENIRFDIGNDDIRQKNKWKFTCPRCSFTAHLSNNLVQKDGETDQ